MTKKKNGTGFLIQGSILAIASIISRIIGLIYRIPMTKIIGDVGNSYYGTAFEVYNIMLIISSYSLPLAVSKLVSASVAKGRYKNAFQIFKGALLFALISGTLVALIVFFGADFITADILKSPRSGFALKILGPALVVVAILGVIRGFFQGMGTMIPSAISQILEQIANAIVSVWAAYVLYNYGLKIGAVLGDPEGVASMYGAGGGTLGTNLGSVIALIFCVVVLCMYSSVYRRKIRREKNVSVSPFSYIMKTLIITIIPVLLSTTVYNISGVLDNIIFRNIASLQGYMTNDVDVMWGVFSGKYKLLINVPISIASAMAASSVPALTKAYEEKDKEAIHLQINSAIRFIMVIAFPCAVGLAVLGYPILILLFPDSAGTAGMGSLMLWIGGIAVVFYSLSTLSNGLLQGINRMKAPVKNAAIALVIHLVILALLMIIFRMNIYAVVLSNVAFSLIMCLLNGLSLKRYSGYRQEYKRTFFIPLVCSAIMGVVTAAVYYGLHALTHNIVFPVIIAIVIAVVVYAVSLLLLKGLTESEIKRFPKGTSLVKLFRKLHLLK